MMASVWDDSRLGVAADPLHAIQLGGNAHMRCSSVPVRIKGGAPDWGRDCRDSLRMGRRPRPQLILAAAAVQLPRGAPRPLRQPVGKLRLACARPPGGQRTWCVRGWRRQHAARTASRTYMQAIMQFQACTCTL